MEVMEEDYGCRQKADIDQNRFSWNIQRRQNALLAGHLFHKIFMIVNWFRKRQLLIDDNLRKKIPSEMEVAPR